MKDHARGARSSGQARGLRVRCANACFKIPSFAGLVVLAGSLNPIPSRTRPLNFPAPMVVRLKTRESRSLPGLPRTEFPLHMFDQRSRRGGIRGGFFVASVQAAAMQLISTSNGPCQGATQMKPRVGGSVGK